MTMNTELTNLKTELDAFIEAHPGKPEQEVLQKLFIRVDNEGNLHVEKKTFLTKVKIFFSKFFSENLKKQYVFKNVYDAILEKFPQGVRDQADMAFSF